jgi:patched 1 protein
VIDHRLNSLGHWIGKNCGKVLFIGILFLITLSVGLKSLKLETSIDRLWVEEGGRIEQELKYIKSTLGEDIGSTDQLVIQTSRDVNANILYTDALLHHLEVMKTATELTVDMFEVTWRLKDVCLTPSIPSYEESHIERIIDMLMPCSIMTPLDCFWEGSKLLGPEVPVSVPGIPSWNLKWTNLNPQQLMESVKAMQDLESSSSRVYGRSSSSFFNIKSSFPNFFSFSQDIMKRVSKIIAGGRRCSSPLFLSIL